MSLSGITQYYINTGGEEWKFETLTDIFASICVPQTVVFANTRRKVDWLSEKLQKDGFTVTAAHGDLDQETRDHVMKEFRAGRRLVPGCIYHLYMPFFNSVVYCNFCLTIHIRLHSR